MGAILNIPYYIYLFILVLFFSIMLSVIHNLLKKKIKKDNQENTNSVNIGINYFFIIIMCFIFYLFYIILIHTERHLSFNEYILKPVSILYMNLITIFFIIIINGKVSFDRYNVLTYLFFLLTMFTLFFLDIINNLFSFLFESFINLKEYIIKTGITKYTRYVNKKKYGNLIQKGEDWDFLSVIGIPIFSNEYNDTYDKIKLYKKI